MSLTRLIRLRPIVSVVIRSVCSASPRANSCCPDMWTVEERGAPYGPDYRLYFRDAEGPISPLHDIPLWADRAAGEAHMVVEIPRWTNAKMEICMSEPLNPIRQDLKRGQLRYVHNVFPHRGYIWNYGALPQTWEDPAHVEPATGARGDDDPVDVLEIGSRVATRGEVLRVRLLGALALLDEGETDWKLLAVDVNDPLAERLKDVRDVEREKPGLLRATIEWLRLYKVPDGKPPNAFGFEGRAQDRDVALRVADQCHAAWEQLSRAPPAPHAARLPRPQAAQLVADAPPAQPARPVPLEVDHWHFVADQ